MKIQLTGLQPDFDAVALRECMAQFGPVVDVPAVRLCGPLGAWAVGRESGLEARSDLRLHRLRLLAQAKPVVLRIRRGAPVGLPVGVGVSPVLLRLVRVLQRIDVAEDLEDLVGIKVDAHGLCLPCTCQDVAAGGQFADPGVQQVDLVAEVTAAAPLTDAQRTRLGTILARIYCHPIALKYDVDPEILGGLHITVADEVIDGAIASRLAGARLGLPD